MSLTRRQFLKRTVVATGALVIAGTGYRSMSHHIRRDFDPERTTRLLESIQPATRPADLPNVIIIFTDDLGYGDLGTYGGDVIHTPNLNRMAAEGTRLTSFYASAALCSPSRAGLLTGRYPIRTMVTGSLYPQGSGMNLLMELAGFYTYGVRGIPEDEALLPEMLQRRGYTTALLGKWHLGDTTPHLPNENGFDQFYGAFYSNGMHPYRLYRNDQIVEDVPVDQDRLTQNLTKEAITFIRQHREKPFFLYLAHPMPHEPIHASAAYRGRSAAGLYGDAVEEIDWSVGKVIETLGETGLDEKTLVIFMSDNGPWWQGSPGLTRGRKNTPLEGGFRVPFIARWPGQINAGRVSDEMAMNIDVTPTLLKLAGIPLPADREIDGKDILPMLRNDAKTPHEMLFYFRGKTLVGVRSGPWKYLRRHMTDNGGYASLSQGPFLFNVERDPNESYSLIESEPARARALDQRLQVFDNAIRENIRGWRG